MVQAVLDEAVFTAAPVSMNMTAMKIVVSFVAHVAMVVAAHIAQQASIVMATAVYAAGVVHPRMAVGASIVRLVVMRIKSKGE